MSITWKKISIFILLSMMSTVCSSVDQWPTANSKQTEFSMTADINSTVDINQNITELNDIKLKADPANCGSKVYNLYQKVRIMREKMNYKKRILDPDLSCNLLYRKFKKLYRRLRRMGFKKKVKTKCKAKLKILIMKIKKIDTKKKTTIMIQKDNGCCAKKYAKYSMVYLRMLVRRRLRSGEKKRYIGIGVCVVIILLLILGYFTIYVNGTKAKKSKSAKSKSKAEKSLMKSKNEKSSRKSKTSDVSSKKSASKTKQKSVSKNSKSLRKSERSSRKSGKSLRKSEKSSRKSGKSSRKSSTKNKSSKSKSKK